MKRRKLDFDINSDAFEDLRLDFNQILRDLIKNMMENNDAKGTISCKVDITIADVFDKDLGEAYKEPQIKVKTESNISRKIGTESELAGQMQMIFDDLDQRWKIVDRPSAQMGMEDLE